MKYHRPGVPPVVTVSGRAATEKRRWFSGRAHFKKDEAICVLTVEDNGIGFDESQTDRIFEPFQRLVASSEYEGSGIGMATVKKIVDRHRGMIEAQSTLGEGSTFTIVFPVRFGVSVSPTTAQSDEKAEANLSSNSRRSRVLIVDDDPADSALAVHELQECFGTSAVASAEEALTLLARESFDVILTDYNMPRSDGVRLLQTVKNRHPGILRLLTSSERLELSAEMKNGVVQGFFPKIAKAEEVMSICQETAMGGTTPAPSDTNKPHDLKHPAL